MLEFNVDGINIRGHGRSGPLNREQFLCSIRVANSYSPNGSYTSLCRSDYIFTLPFG